MQTLSSWSLLTLIFSSTLLVKVGQTLSPLLYPRTPHDRTQRCVRFPLRSGLCPRDPSGDHVSRDPWDRCTLPPAVTPIGLEAEESSSYVGRGVHEETKTSGRVFNTSVYKRAIVCAHTSAAGTRVS